MLRVHFTPYWRASPGSCVAPTATGMSRLVVGRAGPFVLRAMESSIAVLESLVDGDRRRCAAT
jgi:hypothetical protein